MNENISDNSAFAASLRFTQMPLVLRKYAERQATFHVVKENV